MRGLIALAMLMAVPAAAENYEQTLGSSSAPHVEIDIKAGSLHVIGWDRNEIRVEGTLNSNSEIDFDCDGDDADIEVSSTRGNRGGSADLVVHVPHGSSLEIDAVSTNVDVEDVAGEELEIDTVSGHVTVDGASGTIEIEGVSAKIELIDVSGEVSVENVSSPIIVSGTPREVSVETVSSEIRLDVDRASIEAQTVSGQIRVNGEEIHECSASAVSSSIEFRGSLSDDGDLELNSHSGTITIRFSRPVYGDYDLSTFSGSVNCSLEPLDDVRSSKRGLRFEFGDGDASIQAETFSGSVNVD